MTRLAFIVAVLCLVSCASSRQAPLAWSSSGDSCADVAGLDDHSDVSFAPHDGQCPAGFIPGAAPCDEVTSWITGGPYAGCKACASPAASCEETALASVLMSLRPGIDLESAREIAREVCGQ